MRLLVKDAGEAGAVGGEAILVHLATELDGRGVRVLADAAHVVVGTDATLVDLLGVHTILGVEVLNLARGEDTVDAPVDLVLGAHGVEEREALLLAGELKEVGTLAHDRRAASLSSEREGDEEREPVSRGVATKLSSRAVARREIASRIAARG